MTADAHSVQAVLSFEDVRFRYPDAPFDTLDIPALSLRAGERMLIKGDSGCGKSTLLSLAAGVLSASSGRVSLLGTDWQQCPRFQRDARRVDHVGYVFQQFNLLPYLSVIDNVILPCRLSAVRRERALQAAHSVRSAAEGLLRSLGLSDALWQRPASLLSVGQQQRVAAARALLGAPELVIADEPTSALDETHRDVFMQLLSGQCESSRCALLFVSHDMRLAHHFERVIDLPRLNRAAQTSGHEVSVP